MKQIWSYGWRLYKRVYCNTEARVMTQTLKSKGKYFVTVFTKGQLDHTTQNTFRDIRVLSCSLFEIVVSPSLTQNIAKLCALFESTDFKLLKCTSYSTTARHCSRPINRSQLELRENGKNASREVLSHSACTKPCGIIDMWASLKLLPVLDMHARYEGKLGEEVVFAFLRTIVKAFSQRDNWESCVDLSVFSKGLLS